MNINDMLFDFDDILIEPTTITPINSRKEVSCLTSLHTLPLMTAPMDTVVDENNYEIFRDEGVICVLPRGVRLNDEKYSTKVFYSYSLDEFTELFVDQAPHFSSDGPIKVLIDVANGHMSRLFSLAEYSKTKYGDNICLMVGNVANPETFREYSKIGVDFIRVGIGNGNGCLTTVQTGVGFPMASLINECNEIRNQMTTQSKIVADGGFKKYSDVIKGIGLGADYVMLGSTFNKALESAGETTREDGERINQYNDHSRELFNSEIPLFKVFRGMSTKEVQKKWGKNIPTTSEGVVRRNRVEYTLSGWIENFKDYLKSAMSYSGKKQLHDFIGGATFNLISENSFKRFNK